MAYPLSLKSISLFACLFLFLMVSVTGCVEEGSDDAYLLQGLASEILGDSNFFGIAGTIIGKVDTSASTVNGAYYQKKGPINPDEGEYPMVIVFESGGVCKIYEDKSGDWRGNYIATLRYVIKDGYVSILIGGENDSKLFIILGVRDGGSLLENDDNTFVRI